MKKYNIRISTISILTMFLYQIIKFYELFKYPNHLLIVFVIDTLIILLLTNWVNLDIKIKDLIE